MPYPSPGAKYHAECSQAMASDRDRQRRRVLRQRIWDHKVAIGCQRCGFAAHGAALDWHHPDGDKERRLSVRTYFTALGAAERAKCVLLCANCHRIEHADEDGKIAENGDVYGTREGG